MNGSPTTSRPCKATRAHLPRILGISDRHQHLRRLERGQVQVADLLAASGDQPVALSSITASELLHGVERADGAQRRTRRAAFVETILTAIAVLPVDLDVARVHARIWADLRARGQMIGAHDMLIAATALHHEMRIATRNPRDFERIEDLSVEVW